MDYVFKATFNEDGGWYFRKELGEFTTLEAAKRAIAKYLKENPVPVEKRHIGHADCPCCTIIQEPVEGLDIITHWKLPYEPGYKRWIVDDDKENFVKTIEYRGIKVNVYADDCGQCYYIRWRGKHNDIQKDSCGSYNPDYEDVARYRVDEMLDHIAGGNQFEPYYGTELRYINPEHTHAELTHRLQSVQIYNKEQGDFTNEDDLLAKAKIDIENFCNSPEYLKAEEERLKAIESGDTGKMYFSDLIKKMESEE